MGLVPEDRASARSDEPEARSYARWRDRAVGDSPDVVAERWPAIASLPAGSVGLRMMRSRPLARTVPAPLVAG